jgi:hypothetical protein
MLESANFGPARLYRYSICIKANNGAAKATRHAEDVRHVNMRRQSSGCEMTANVETQAAGSQPALRAPHHPPNIK